MRRTRSLSCACAASGHAAAPPRSVMNSRRFMGAPTSALGPDITTPLRKNAAVHHSKNCVMMSQMGHSRPRPAKPKAEACPLRPRSRQTGRRFTKSASCQDRP
jgi:hypothetical protein